MNFFMVFKVYVLVFFQYRLAVVVQLYDKAVRCLDSSHFYMVWLYVTPFEVVYVRIAQPAETAEQKDVPYPFKVLLGRGYLVVFQSVQFLPCEEYHFLGCVFQLGFEAVISHVLIVPFLETPPQEPFQEGYLLACKSNQRHCRF